MIFLKVLTFVVICGAIWLTVHFTVARDDRDAGVVSPSPERESPLKRFFSTPEPPPDPGPKFSH